MKSPEQEAHRSYANQSRPSSGLSIVGAGDEDDSIDEGEFMTLLEWAIVFLGLCGVIACGVLVQFGVTNHAG